MKSFASILVATLAVTGCGKDSQGKQNQALTGVYTESSPAVGSTQLSFISPSLMIETGDQLIDPSGVSPDTLRYQISGDRLYFSSVGSTRIDTTVLYFQLSGWADTLTLTSCAPGLPCYATGSAVELEK